MQAKQKKILIFGGSGLIGSELVKTLSENYSVTYPSQEEVDVTNQNQMRQCIESDRPNFLIYATGLARVDEAERDKDKAFSLNSEAPAFIAECAKEISAPLLYFSTDAVFDGTRADRPYKEDDAVNPLSVYGKSKLAGEEAVLGASIKNIILRITMAYSAFYLLRKDSARIILEALEQKHPIGGITDQYLTPIFAPVAARGIDRLFGSTATGIYNLGSTDFCTNYDFAKKIAQIFGYDEELIFPTTLEEFSKDKSAYRGKYAWLDTTKFRSEFGEGILRTVEEDLIDFKNKVLASRPS